MTIRLLTPYDKYPINAIVSLDTGTEAGLIAQKMATANTAGGVVYMEPATANQLVSAQFEVGPSGEVLGLSTYDRKAVKLTSRASTVAQLTAGQPLGIADNVVSAGRMFCDFSANRMTAVSNVTRTTDYTGMDPVTGDVTGIQTRTGLPSMVLIQPTADAASVAVFNTYLNGATGINIDGTLGIWVYADLTGKTSGGQLSVAVTPLTTTSFSADNLAISFNANQIRNGWNFLVWKQRDIAANLPSTETPFSGLVIRKYGTGADSDMKQFPLKYLTINFENCNGCKFYFDSLWTGFSTKPQFCIGVDQATPDTIQYALPVFERYGWVGYVAATRDVWVSGTKVISNWTPDAYSVNSFNAMRKLYDAGWDVINHTANHYNLAPETNPAAIRYEIEAAKAWYAQNGFTRGQEFYASPQSGTSDLAEKVIANCGIKLQRHARHSNVHVTPFGIDNPNSVGSIDMGNSTAYQKFSRIKAWIDNIVLYGATGFPFWHSITLADDTGSGEDTVTLPNPDLYMTKSAFELVMAYLRKLELAGAATITRGMTGFYYGAKQSEI